jgi:hypothetical protein
MPSTTIWRLSGRIASFAGRALLLRALGSAERDVVFRRMVDGAFVLSKFRGRLGKISSTFEETPILGVNFYLDEACRYIERLILSQGIQGKA